jgi:Zn-dependent protease with chaperone function
MQRQLGQKLADKLFDDIASHPFDLAARRRPKRSASLLLAYAIAVAVHGASLVFLAAGLAIVLAPWTNFFVVLLGVVMLMLAWLSIPRRSPPPDDLLSRADFPMLHAVADRLAAAMDAPPIDGIAISKEFSANYRSSGWRGRRYVELGLPLLAVLTPRERVALLAHELSHGANGDPLRGQFLFGAVNTIATWADAIRPLSIGWSADGVTGGPIVSIIAIPFELLQLAVSEVLVRIGRGVLLLVLRESQRAEYLADRLAASVSGAGPMRTALEKTYLGELVEDTVRRHALTDSEAPLLPKVTAAAASLTSEELERLAAESRQASWQVDTTHPPTALRVRMLEGHDAQPIFVLSDEEAAALDAELASLTPRIERQLVAHYLVGIYG